MSDIPNTPTPIAQSLVHGSSAATWRRITSLLPRSRHWLASCTTHW